MQQRPIPSSGEALPVIGLGTYQAFDFSADSPQEQADATATMQIVLGGGARLIDSSPMYGQAEKRIGDILRALHPSEKPFLATKVWIQGEAAGKAQMERSFQLLQTRTIDLMQVHNLVDVAIHLKTLQVWQQKGRVRYLGITHYHSGAYTQLEDWLNKARLDFLQINYSLLEPEAEKRLFPLCRDKGIAVIVNRPFAEGALFRRVEGRAVPPWAAEIACQSWGQLFLKWILGHPAVTCVIPATRNPRHAEDNVGAGLSPMPDAAMCRKIRAVVMLD